MTALSPQNHFSVQLPGRVSTATSHHPILDLQNLAAPTPSHLANLDLFIPRQDPSRRRSTSHHRSGPHTTSDLPDNTDLCLTSTGVIFRANKKAPSLRIVVEESHSPIPQRDTTTIATPPRPERRRPSASARAPRPLIIHYEPSTTRRHTFTTDAAANMCVTNEYSYVYPDGRREKLPRQTTLCPASRHGAPCVNNVTYKYPAQEVPFPGQQASSAPAGPSPYLSAHHTFPPTPTYTPRSSTPNYRSGDESDRSASRTKAKSHRAPTVYINGQKVYDSSSSSASPPPPSSRRRAGERVVLGNGPPSPRTPSSPSSPYLDDPRRQSFTSSSRRPIIVDDRSSRVEIDIVETPRRHHKKEHKRHGSSSSYNSHSSYDEDYDDERRRRRDAEREARRQAQYDARMRDRIAQANVEISRRPPVPMPPAPPRRSDSTTAQAGSSRDREAELVDAVRRMDIRERRHERRERDAEYEAQRQRLMERMTPRRAVSVGGRQRERVVYPDGTYRWE